MTKIALLGAIAVAAMSSNAANAAQVTGTAEVDIISGVTLTQNANLDFGIVASNVAAGTVAIPSSSDTRTCTTVACGGTAHRAQFTISNTAPNMSILVTVEGTGVLGAGPGTPMNFSTAPSLSGTVASTGSDIVFYVGGTLTVNAGQLAGTYTGDYDVTANYQ